MICISFDSPEVGEHLRYPSHVDLTSRSDFLEAQSEINFQKTQFSPFFEQFLTHFDQNFMENQKQTRLSFLASLYFRIAFNNCGFIDVEWIKLLDCSSGIQQNHD